jgi:quercetin dioxygenase-like cupin family protein
LQQSNESIESFEANSESAPAFWQVNILWFILADTNQTGGTMSLLEELCPRDSGPPPHFHTQNEFFYILDGSITFLVNGKELVGSAGSFVSVPAKTVHSFRVDTETARILNWYVPGGFERVVQELGEPTTQRVLPPRGRPNRAASSEEIKRLFSEVGMTTLNEPDTLRENSL